MGTCKREDRAVPAEAVDGAIHEAIHGFRGLRVSNFIAMSLAADDEGKAGAMRAVLITADHQSLGLRRLGEELQRSRSATEQECVATKCSACHSVTNDLSKIASRITDPKRLQDAWLAGGTREEEQEEEASEGTAPTARTVTASITLPSGETVEGKLIRVDDFFVTLALADGSQNTFRRSGDQPKLVIHDPLKVHRDLLSQHSDKDIHDVTAYLATLK